MNAGNTYSPAARIRTENQVHKPESGKEASATAVHESSVQRMSEGEEGQRSCIQQEEEGRDDEPEANPAKKNQRIQKKGRQRVVPKNSANRTELNQIEPELLPKATVLPERRASRPLRFEPRFQNCLRQ